MDTAKSTLIERLERIVGKDGVFSRPADLLVYEYDGSVEGAVETGEWVAQAIIERRALRGA